MKVGGGGDSMLQLMQQHRKDGPVQYSGRMAKMAHFCFLQAETSRPNPDPPAWPIAVGLQDAQWAVLLVD